MLLHINLSAIHTHIMKLKILFTLLSFTFLLSLSNCRKDDPEPCNEQTIIALHIGDSMRSKVPHTGHDTLVFYNQYGDTVFLRGTGVEKFTTTGDMYYAQAKCGSAATVNVDFEQLNYEQDTLLSNTSKEFILKSILINADSNSEFSNATEKRGGCYFSK